MSEENPVVLVVDDEVQIRRFLCSARIYVTGLSASNGLGLLPPPLAGEGWGEGD
jgi:hypothetical protein